MPLLPEEFGGSQEQAGHFFPTHHVVPKVDQDRQVTPGADPLGVHRHDDRFGGRPNGQALFQFLITAMSYPGYFGSESLHMFRFFGQKAFRDKKGKVGVLVAGSFQPSIQGFLDQFPDAVAVRPIDHAALDRGIVGQFCPAHDLHVPVGKILRFLWNCRDEFFRHIDLSFPDVLRDVARQSIRCRFQGQPAAKTGWADSSVGVASSVACPK